jgi:hypothetical protein
MGSDRSNGPTVALCAIVLLITKPERIGSSGALTSVIDRGGERKSRVQFESVRQHDDGLRAALTFIHRKPDRLGPVREQAAAKASGVLDHPVTASIPPDKQAGQAGGTRGSDILLDHEFSSFADDGPGAFFRRAQSTEVNVRPRSVGRHPYEQFRH